MSTSLFSSSLTDLQDERVLLRTEHPRPRHDRPHRQEAAQGAGRVGGDRLHEGAALSCSSTVKPRYTRDVIILRFCCTRTKKKRTVVQKKSLGEIFMFFFLFS